MVSLRLRSSAVGAARRLEFLANQAVCSVHGQPQKVGTLVTVLQGRVPQTTVSERRFPICGYLASSMRKLRRARDAEQFGNAAGYCAHRDPVPKLVGEGKDVHVVEGEDRKAAKEIVKTDTFANASNCGLK
jgi:hypothetical protein